MEAQVGSGETGQEARRRHVQSSTDNSGFRNHGRKWACLGYTLQGTPGGLGDAADMGGKGEREADCLSRGWASAIGRRLLAPRDLAKNSGVLF